MQELSIELMMADKAAMTGAASVDKHMTEESKA